MNIIKGFAGYGLAGLFLQYVCVLLLFLPETGRRYYNC